MKLKFKRQSFQEDAVRAVVDLFHGANRFAQNDLVLDGMGANPRITDEVRLWDNLREVQGRMGIVDNDIRMGEKFPSFSIEMETGTGKTFVFTKTILELHKQYGLRKFIIVVPSVAIREGVCKSLDITKEYFRKDYKNTYDNFIYNSNGLGELRSFATDTTDCVRIMIITIGAFNKDTNILNDYHERFESRKPIEYIQKIRPVVIIDEPQSVDNTSKARDSIRSLNPLFVLRYSATHRTKQNLVYRLTPVDAFRKDLVKRISVISHEVINDHNHAYIKLMQTVQVGGFSAKVEIDCQNEQGKVKRKTVYVKCEEDLHTITGRDIYQGYVVDNIDCTPEKEYICFKNGIVVTKHQVSDNAAIEQSKRKQMIWQTIKTHLDKEKSFAEAKKGIKVLSLFFIDKVDKYRVYENDEPQKGEYAREFEECYLELIKEDKYKELRERYGIDVEKMHEGYFSVDKKKRFKKTTGGDSADDALAYELIMKDKEKLLSFECPVRFIFSHSALKEGWDNPNVFQVCTLLEQKSALTCRQKIGRGLRLCVDQSGERVDDMKYNNLHVIADESFGEFADKLQKEIEDEAGYKFGVYVPEMLIDLEYTEEEFETRHLPPEIGDKLMETWKENGTLDENGHWLVSDITVSDFPACVHPELRDSLIAMAHSQESVSTSKLLSLSYKVSITKSKKIDKEKVQIITKDLKACGVVDSKMKINSQKRMAFQNGELVESRQYSRVERDVISKALEEMDARPPVINARSEKKIRVKKEVLSESVFKNLWNRINQKTQYIIHFNKEDLIEESVKRLKEQRVSPVKIKRVEANIGVSEGGVTSKVKDGGEGEGDIDGMRMHIPDILTLISNHTRIKRSTILEIIKRSNKVEEILINPQMFIENMIEVINNAKKEVSQQGVKYAKIDDEYGLDLFEDMDTYGNYLVDSSRSVYPTIKCDSKIEEEFVKAMSRDEDVKLFVKLPPKFKIDTPVGGYNPDWAIYLTKKGVDRLYFIVETKGTNDISELRPDERIKIECGEKHFRAISAEAVFYKRPFKTWEDFKQRIRANNGN